MFLGKRLLGVAPTVFGVTLIMFILTVLIPGDPTLLRLGNFATDEQVRAMRQELGLDEPLLQRFFLYLKGMLKGELGRSLRTGNPVVADLASRLPATVELALASLVLALGVGIPGGVLWAGWGTGKGGLLPRALSVVGVCLPPFWLALLFIYFFYYLLGWAPAPTGRMAIQLRPPPVATGFLTLDSLLVGDLRAFASALSHLILPALTLGLIVGASIARMTYVSMRQVLAAPFVLTAKAYGFSRHRIAWVFALRNALLPVITLSGLQTGFLIGGVVLVEVVFAIPGIGRYAVDSLVVNDFAPVQGFVLVVTLVYIGVNFFADFLYGVVNPQLRA